LEEEFANEDVPHAAGRCCFEMDYLSKFWCSLAFVEQYWNVAKQATREKCDYTITTLKAVFPVALATACDHEQMCCFMKRSLNHAKALTATGRHGDFTKYPSLAKSYTKHRDSLRLSMGVDGSPARRVRERGQWGAMEHARRLPLGAGGGGGGGGSDDDGGDGGGGGGGGSDDDGGDGGDCGGFSSDDNGGGGGGGASSGDDGDRGGSDGGGEGAQGAIAGGGGGGIPRSRLAAARAAAAAFEEDERLDRETAPWRSVAEALEPAGRFGRSRRTE